MPIYDRFVEFDERSRNYGVADAVPSAEVLRTTLWPCQFNLDQGQQGACVGFGWNHEKGAEPVVIPVTYDTAINTYHAAQALDGDPNPHEGSSVIAGAKAVVNEGYLSEYRWAFTLNDTILALVHLGPAVLGVNWYEGMEHPDAHGFIFPTGAQVGGHCILANGIYLVPLDPTKPKTIDNIDYNRSVLRLHNSWGADWAINGECYMLLKDFEIIRQQQADVCIPVTRLTHA